MKAMHRIFKKLAVCSYKPKTLVKNYATGLCFILLPLIGCNDNSAKVETEISLPSYEDLGDEGRLDDIFFENTVGVGDLETVTSFSAICGVIQREGKHYVWVKVSSDFYQNKGLAMFQNRIRRRELIWFEEDQLKAFGDYLVDAGNQYRKKYKFNEELSVDELPDHRWTQGGIDYWVSGSIVTNPSIGNDFSEKKSYEKDGSIRFHRLPASLALEVELPFNIEFPREDAIVLTEFYAMLVKAYQKCAEENQKLESIDES